MVGLVRLSNFRLFKRASAPCVAKLSKQSDGKLLFTVTEKATLSETVKKSKFVASVYPASSIDTALKLLHEVSDPKATHNCWAFNSVQYQRSSDDGEPAGTAGRPILAALSTEGVVDALVVVTRYYGGINLGTGGLARAYGGTALQVLKSAGKISYTPMKVLSFTVPLKELGDAFALLKNHQVVEKLPMEGSMVLKVAVPEADIGAVKEKLQRVSMVELTVFEFECISSKSAPNPSVGKS